LNMAMYRALWSALPKRALIGCSGHAAVAATATATAAPARSAAAAAAMQWNSPATAHYLHTSAAHAADNKSSGSGSGGGKGSAGGKGSKGGRRDNADKRRGGKEYNEAESLSSGGDGDDDEREPADPPPVFNFSFDPADQQVFLKTGTVSTENVAAVRAEIKAHSDFSDELKLVDKSTHSVELYFLRVVAVNLARNPHMTVEEKREMISGIREMITDPALLDMADEEDEE